MMSGAADHPDIAPASSEMHSAAPRGALAALYSRKNLEEIASETSEAERRANGAERELMDWKTAQFMEEHLGEEYDGLIISIQKFGCFIELFEVFVEGLLPISALEEFAGTRCALRERDHAIVALQGGGGRGSRGTRRVPSASSSVRTGGASSARLVSRPGTAASPPGPGAKPRQLEWHLGDKVRVRAERTDPMRKRVEFALIP